MAETTPSSAVARRGALAGLVACACLHLGCRANDCEALPEPRAYLLLDEDDEEAAVATEGDCEQPLCDTPGEIGCLGWTFRMTAYSAECALGITFADGTEAVTLLDGREADECGHLYVRVGYE